MCDIISIINVKGGVGKTTSAINIADQLAKNEHKVLLIYNDSLISGYWYYFNTDGSMLTNTTIDGYKIDADGHYYV